MLIKVVWLTKRTLNILELSWYERFGKRKKKLTSFSATSHIVRTIAERVISRREFGMRGWEMIHCQICKFATPLSPLLPKLPLSNSNAEDVRSLCGRTKVPHCWVSARCHQNSTYFYKNCLSNSLCKNILFVPWGDRSWRTPTDKVCWVDLQSRWKRRTAPCLTATQLPGTTFLAPAKWNTFVHGEQQKCMSRVESFVLTSFPNSKLFQTCSVGKALWRWNSH